MYLHKPYDNNPSTIVFQDTEEFNKNNLLDSV